jgi:o-succinylbenzoate synthase
MPEATGFFRLTGAEAILVRVPFRRPIANSTGEHTHRRSWILRLFDDQGHEGLGEAAVSPFADEVTTEALARLMREIVPALPAGSLPAWADLAAEGEPGRAAMAAVEGAMADLTARRGAVRAGETGPAGTGGAAAATIPVSATVNFGGPDAGAEAATQAVELGFGTLKLRAGFERSTDHLVARIRAIRSAVGPEPEIRIDAGGAWDLETATERLDALRPFRIEYVEQPLPAWDLTGHATLRERTRIPVALDESIASEGDARAALAEGSADVLIVKPARVGGSSACRRIIAMASAAGVSVVLGSHTETGVGIAAALRLAGSLTGTIRPSAHEPAHGLATAGILIHDLLETPLPISHGRMTVPGTLVLDETALSRYALERFEARGG